jgi:hypothetical protein
MITEDEVLRALDKPRKLFALQQTINSSTKQTDALHSLLLAMRKDGKITFDIKSGRWEKK